ncbi:hypothetical protein AciPR4_4266 [Terriglobus saanensis SP1PR4]|uniref:Uncharacterized protein n=1 Tax=Terriglobus saanensis (strain ATCC BAA-1853 / DSM 23119 / SP1PR4) TaxID=401053 RepID=E8V6Y5_TERSS|nr:hypothetical protein AciPR4_4266 [Terriglobus saanensis SP1PR4]
MRVHTRLEAPILNRLFFTLSSSVRVRENSKSNWQRFWGQAGSSNLPTPGSGRFRRLAIATSTLFSLTSPLFSWHVSDHAGTVL